MRSVRPSFEMSTDTKTDRRSGAKLVANLNFDFTWVMRQHTLDVVENGDSICGFCLQCTPLSNCEKMQIG